MIKRRLIDYALQQFTGYKIGKWSSNILELVSSMGLTREEWEFIKKKEEPSSFLDEDDVEDIDKMFEESSDKGEQTCANDECDEMLEVDTNYSSLVYCKKHSLNKKGDSTK